MNTSIVGVSFDDGIAIVRIHGAFSDCAVEGYDLLRQLYKNSPVPWSITTADWRHEHNLNITGTLYIAASVVK